MAVPNGNYDEIAAMGRSDYDMLIIETEHVEEEFSDPAHSLLYLLNRQRMVENGLSRMLCRWCAFRRTRERSRWVVKQTLTPGPLAWYCRISTV